eukprot:365479-Chlamydomonas_euryale.AAC.10
MRPSATCMQLSVQLECKSYKHSWAQLYPNPEDHPSCTAVPLDMTGHIVGTHRLSPRTECCDATDLWLHVKMKMTNKSVTCTWQSSRPGCFTPRGQAWPRGDPVESKSVPSVVRSLPSYPSCS